MKTLLLMRHAKSSWKLPDLSDHDRPLNHRGEEDAPRMGHLLKKQGPLPQRIFCSTALRARQTAAAVAEKMDFTGPVLYMDELYLAEPSAIAAVLASAPDEVERLMLIGHNPAMEEMLLQLTGQSRSFSTAAIAVIALPLDHWSDLTLDASGKLLSFLEP